jgi:hypothetical protein
MGRAMRRAFDCPPGDVDFMQLSMIRGAPNGKVETSRGRKSPPQEYIGVSPQAAYSDEARALNPLYRNEKRVFGV